MPVTTRPSPSEVGKNRDPEIAIEADDDTTVLEAVTRRCRSSYEGDPRHPPAPRMRIRTDPSPFRGLPIIASSIAPENSMNSESPKNSVSIYDNGFVNGLIRAFNQDLHLIIRPDDVWQAILSQFSLFVNGNVERLRHLFVAHKGKKALEIDIRPMSFSRIDFGMLAKIFAAMIQHNVVDPELRKWMIPEFTTTTQHDKTVAAFSMMGTMKGYFKYELRGGCGLPSVTLLGSRHDWEMLASQVNKLYDYGEECAHWANLLQPIMRYMLRTFDEPDSQKVKDFWLRVAYQAGKEGSGIGIRTLSGWITAFTYFDENGKVARHYTEEDIHKIDEKSDARIRSWGGTNIQEYVGLERKRLTLDGVSYPLIRPGQIPGGIILFPMTLTDEETNQKRYATVVSGTIGMSISEHGTTAQPVSAWWVVRKFQEPM
ncbi:hypothetical protein F5B22DRAFT_109765 [Xylaria bambusicola]|uniref:uncharacterized protein n=1 Tax=Xylaria bambusicola TaxID=326684 RepID=UPI002008468B|nr:uncharacterized protein F5B22DRAFT_109765 [Xylaria bambusicola]KAI0517558.1 hypothetical protein F5B22DRAFT_109765 [Xylaria bambusicola]